MRHKPGQVNKKAAKQQPGAHLLSSQEAVAVVSMIMVAAVTTIQGPHGEMVLPIFQTKSATTVIKRVIYRASVPTNKVEEAVEATEVALVAEGAETEVVNDAL